MQELYTPSSLLLTVFFLFAPSPDLAKAQQLALPKIRNISVEMPKKTFLHIYPKKQARTYRQDNLEQWLTFNYPLTGAATDTITFHIKNDKVKDWQLNDRAEIITEYMSEFSSQAFKRSFPTIYAAIRDVLQRIPYSDFLKVTDRRRPTLFTEVFDTGTAKFANSSEIIAMPDDAPAFQDGLTIIKLSTSLDTTQNQKAVAGVVAHELAHRILEHVKNGKRTCAAEREANTLIKQWGFENEYQQASSTFGQKVAGIITDCQN